MAVHHSRRGAGRIGEIRQKASGGSASTGSRTALVRACGSEQRVSFCGIAATPEGHVADPLRCEPEAGSTPEWEALSHPAATTDAGNQFQSLSSMGARQSQHAASKVPRLSSSSRAGRAARAPEESGVAAAIPPWPVRDDGGMERVLSACHSAAEDCHMRYGEVTHTVFFDWSLKSVNRRIWSCAANIGMLQASERATIL